MRGNPDFRNPVWRERALRDRNNGIGKAHSSWDRQAEHKRRANREAESELDCFDLWLIEVKGRVADIMAEARLDVLRLQEGTDEIPF